MDRHYSKKHFVNRRAQQKSRLRWVLLLSVLAILVVGVGFLKSKTLLPYYAKITHWASEKRTQLSKSVTKTKQAVTAQNSVQPEVHFEFYTALPNMQVSLPKSATVEIANADDLEKQLSEAVNQKER